MIPLQDILDKETKGITMETPKGRLTYTHQAYMDDFKIYAENDQELDKSIKVMMDTSKAIGMTLGINKCGQDHYKGPKAGQETNKMIPRINEEAYTYLGIPQKVMNENRQTFEIKKDAIKEKARHIFDNNNEWKDKMQTYNWQIPPVMRYIVMGTYTKIHKNSNPGQEFRDLDKEIRGILTETGNRMKTSSKHRTHMPAQDGGLNIKSLEDTYYESLIARKLYMSSDSKELEKLESLANDLKMDFTEAHNEYYKEVTKEPEFLLITATEFKKKVEQIKKAHKNLLNRRRMERFSKRGQASKMWKTHKSIIPSIGRMLSKGDIKKGQLPNIVAAHEGQIMGVTHPRNWKIPEKLRKAQKCIYCEKPLTKIEEELKHILGVCPQNDHLIKARHDKVAKWVHHYIQKEVMKLHPKLEFDIEPASEIKAGEYTLIYDKIIFGLPLHAHKRPDIILITADQVFIIEIGICNYENIKEKNLLKYERYKKGKDIFDQDKPERSAISLATYLGNLPSYRNKIVEVIPITVGYWGEQLPPSESKNWDKLAKLIGKKTDTLKIKMSCQAAKSSEQILAKYLSQLEKVEQRNAEGN